MEDDTDDDAPFLRPAPGAAQKYGQGNRILTYDDLAAQVRPDLVVVLSADHLYALDVRDVVATHERHGAALTMVTTRTDADPSDHGVVELTGRRPAGR